MADPSAPEIPGSSAQWYACYTRARHEKQVERLLSERGIESYLPLVPKVSQWKDRRKLVQFPLFPGYLFTRFELPDMQRVLGLPGIANIVRSQGRPVPVAVDDLDNVRRFEAALQGGDVPVELVPYMAEGQWVEVMEGPFQGVRGIVVSRRSRRRVLVGLQVIGQGMEVDIDTRVLKPIPAPTH